MINKLIKLNNKETVKLLPSWYKNNSISFRRTLDEYWECYFGLHNEERESMIDEAYTVQEVNYEITLDSMTMTRLLISSEILEYPDIAKKIKPSLEEIIAQEEVYIKVSCPSIISRSIYIRLSARARGRGEAYIKYRFLIRPEDVDTLWVELI